METLIADFVQFYFGIAEFLFLEYTTLICLR